VISTWQFTPYAWLYLAAVGISILLTYLAWKMRPVRGATAFSLMVLSTGVWSLGYLLGFFNTDPSWKLILLRVEYFGIIGADFFWLLFVASYTHFYQWFSRRMIALLSIVPISTYFQILFIQQHTFFYETFKFPLIDGLIIFDKTYAPGFYIWVGYAYLVIITGVGILIRGMINMPEKYRLQLIPLILVIVLILSPNILYIFGSNPIAPYDPTSLMFVVALVYSIGGIFFRWPNPSSNKLNATNAISPP